MDIYYVYAYLRKSDGTPYYIGKGCGERCYKKHNVSVPNDKSKIVFLEKNLSEIGALALERRMIAWYGRKDAGNGILLNMTDGGDGTSGRVVSEETRKKMSKAKKNRKISITAKKRMSEAAKRRVRRPHTEETKQKLSLKHKNKKLSDIHKKKLSDAHKGKTFKHSLSAKLNISLSIKNRKPYLCQYCKRSGTGGFSRWHLENCKSK